MTGYEYRADGTTAYVVDGLTWFGEVDLSEPNYSFDLIGVWRDPADGSWWWVADSGCSCPSPFEGVRSRDDLNRADTPHPIAEAIQKALDDEHGYGVTDEVRANAVEFIGRMMAARMVTS